jgi:hypothetical protein
MRMTPLIGLSTSGGRAHVSQRRPLKVLVTGDNLRDLTIKLRDQGHTVWERQFECVDLIIGEKCIRVTPELVPYFDTTIKEAQRGKYASRQRAKKVPGRKRV